MISVLYLIYFVAVIQTNQVLGDITSPIVTFIILLYIFKGFYLEEKRKYYKTAGLLITLGVLSWFLCDLAWGITSLILHQDPEEYFWIINGYSFLNAFLVLSLVIIGFLDFKHFNKMQVLLDTVITTICLSVMLWVFVFEQDVEKAHLLKSNMIAMLSLAIDVIVFAFMNIWFFSMREKKAPKYLNVTTAGIVVFVVTDFIYYYEYFMLPMNQTPYWMAFMS